MVFVLLLISKKPVFIRNLVGLMMTVWGCSRGENLQGGLRSRGDSLFIDDGDGRNIYLFQPTNCEFEHFGIKSTFFGIL